MDRLLLNFSLAIEGVLMNRLRAILTALGVIFGVAAVIVMLSVGNGARKSILEQMKLIGSNSLVITAQTEEQEEPTDIATSAGNSDDEKKSWSPGLSYDDLMTIQTSVPTVEDISPEIIFNTAIVANGKAGKVKCIGISNSFFDLNNLSVGEGERFTDYHLREGSAVCIIGKRIQSKYFQGQDVIGKKIKCGHNWLTVVGVLANRIALQENLDNLGLRDYNSDVYIPLNTSLIRFANRAKIESSDIKRNNNQEYDDNYHQIDRAVIQVNDLSNIQATTDIIGRILKRRHRNLVDFELQIPELLILQQQKTQDTFNLVLVIIAAISLLVGGIGIMNIMLASVLERIKEIGIRRAVGASQSDITQQFLLEAIFISLIGGIIGAVLGIVCSEIISAAADIPTIVSPWSIMVSFGVAFLVGTIFGYMPAQRAAKQNPIKALRTE